MTQMMDLLSRNVRAHAHGHIEGKHTLSLDTCTHTHTLVLSAAAVICHLDPYQLLSKSAHILFYLTSVGRGDFVRSCKWDPDMQKSCWIKSAGQARPFVDTTRSLPLMIYERCNHHILLVSASHEMAEVDHYVTCAAHF